MAKDKISNSIGSSGGFNFSINMRGLLLIILVLGGAGVQVFQTQQSLELNTEVANSTNLISQVNTGLNLFENLEVEIENLIKGQQQILIDTLSNINSTNLNVTYTTIRAKLDQIDAWFANTDELLDSLRSSRLILPDNYYKANSISVPINNISELIEVTGIYSSNKHLTKDYNFQPIEYKVIQELMLVRETSPSFLYVSNEIQNFISVLSSNANDLSKNVDLLYSVGTGNKSGTFDLIDKQINSMRNDILISSLSNSSQANTEYNLEYSRLLSSLQSSLTLFSNQISKLFANMQTSSISEQTSILYALDFNLDQQEQQFNTSLTILKSGLGQEDTRPEDLEQINSLENLILTNDSIGLIPTVKKTILTIESILSTSTSLSRFLKIDVPTTTALISLFISKTKNSLISDLNQFRTSFGEFYLVQTTLSIVLNVVIIVILIFAVAVVIPLIRIITKLTGKLDKGFTSITMKDLNIDTFDSYDSGEIGRIQQGYDVMVSELRNILKKMQSTSRSLSDIAESMAASSQEASASINQVSDTISTIALGANHQSESMTRIAESLQNHLEEVQSLSDRIQETSEFVKKVAKRTNILGLNASIEAAKAGHFGGGFSVVAENVRELSDDTKLSATQISELIEDVSFKINRTIQVVMNEVSEMKEITENTAAGSEEANASSSEQVEMLSEISEQSAEISRIASELDKIMRDFNF